MGKNQVLGFLKNNLISLIPVVYFYFHMKRTLVFQAKKITIEKRNILNDTVINMEHLSLAYSESSEKNHKSLCTLRE